MVSIGRNRRMRCIRWNGRTVIELVAGHKIGIPMSARRKQTVVIDVVPNVCGHRRGDWEIFHVETADRGPFDFGVVACYELKAVVLEASRASPVRIRVPDRRASPALAGGRSAPSGDTNGTITIQRRPNVTERINVRRLKPYYS
jgi:hypothetical protein